MTCNKYFVNIQHTHCVSTDCQSMHIKLDQNLWRRVAILLSFLNSNEFVLHCKSMMQCVHQDIPSQIPPLAPLCLSAYLCLSAEQHIQLDMATLAGATLDHIKSAIPGTTSAFLISSSHRSSWNWPSIYREREQEGFQESLRNSKRFPEIPMQNFQTGSQGGISNEIPRVNFRGSCCIWDKIFP